MTSRPVFHETHVPRVERLRRLPRLGRVKVWRSLLLGVTEPDNDSHWAFILKRNSGAYLDQAEPWLAPGAADEVLTRTPAGGTVFEWGAGSSTLWFDNHGFSVISLETDETWAREIQDRTTERCQVVLMQERAPGYSTPDLAGYDLVLIDGRSRNACGLHVADTAPSGSYVVLDDSHRGEYAPAMEALSRRSVWQQHWPGLSAMLTPKMTSMFQL